MEQPNMKVICEYAGALRNATAVNDVERVAKTLMNMPGIGKPFLAFNSLPGTVVMADFGMYPEYVVSNNIETNAEMINAMLANPPLDALTFEQ